MELFEYKENKVAVGGIDVFYKTAGKGRPLLILHGWGASSLSWLKIMESIAKEKYEVIIPDLPGFGETPDPKGVWGNKEYAEFVIKFIDKIGLKELFLLGHSFGGGLALRVATENESMIEKLILCDAAIIRKERLNGRQKLSRALSHFGSKLFSGTFLYPSFAKAAYWISGNYDYYKANPLMREVFKKVISEDLSFLLKKVKIPTLIVWGEDDKATPIEDAFTIAESISGSELKVITGSGHNPNRVQPEKLAKIILNFLNK